MTILLILLLTLVTVVDSQTLSQSYIRLSGWSKSFQPANSIELLETQSVSSLLQCGSACNRNTQCRTFDYDSSSRVCRLFEGALETGYTVSAAPRSRVGSLQYLSIFFNPFQQPCSQCTENRYLTCLNNTCQCPVHSFWNGSQCENQRYENESCLNDEWCRNEPFGLICSVSNICIIAQPPATKTISTSIMPTTAVIHTSILPITSATPAQTTKPISTSVFPTTMIIYTSILSTTSPTPSPATKAINTSIVPATSAARTTNAVTTYWHNSATTATAIPVISIFWNFDNNTNDLYNVYNGVPSSISYSALGITGYGAALSVTYSSTSYVSVSSPYVNLQNRSFTVDAWVYPGITMYSNDYLIVTICPSKTNYKCMQVLIRNGKPLLTFYYADCQSLNVLKNSTWVHLAYVYDYASNMMALYVNGYLDTNCAAVSPFQGAPTASLYIGGIASLAMYYSGLIDQLSIVTRVKSASEILETATLVVYYSFDNQSLLDSGPNLINGTGINTGFTLGRVNEGIVFNTTRSYVQINNLVLFSTKFWPYSFAFWIYPYSTENGTVIHMWKPSAPTTYCMPIIGFSASGSIVAQTWNSTHTFAIAGPVITANTWAHIAHTYSPNDGIRLFVNGTLMVSKQAPSMNPAASSPLTMTLGYCVNTTLCSCASGSIVPGQFHGMMDEFQFYSRQLNTSEVLALANP